ncbi:MAG: hypothetical protein DBY37_02630 [Desulfovibrionaceae bacterium]|nr:MAG: hypothetical protein DBY37_02630 [Desulfovibrionaceae bacterium]
MKHLKAGAIAGRPVADNDETSALLEEHIRFYNTERLQKMRGLLSPAGYRGKQAAQSAPAGSFLPVSLTGARPVSGDFLLVSVKPVSFSGSVPRVPASGSPDRIRPWPIRTWLRRSVCSFRHIREWSD